MWKKFSFLESLGLPRVYNHLNPLPIFDTLGTLLTFVINYGE